MFRVTRRYGFAASHRLHTDALSAEENREVYGKCNNPYGHGHDYVLEVSLRGPLDPETGRVADWKPLDALVRTEVLRAFDHKNLNAEVPAFAAVVPTTENLALEIRRRLLRNWAAAFPGVWPRLDRIRIARAKPGD